MVLAERSLELLLAVSYSAKRSQKEWTASISSSKGTQEPFHCLKR